MTTTEADKQVVLVADDDDDIRDLVAFRLWDLLRRKQGWGEMGRKGFAAALPVAPLKLNEVPPPAEVSAELAKQS